MPAERILNKWRVEHISVLLRWKRDGSGDVLFEAVGTLEVVAPVVQVIAGGQASILIDLRKATVAVSHTAQYVSATFPDRTTWTMTERSV